MDPDYTLSASGTSGEADQVVLAKQLSQILRPDAPTRCERSGLDYLSNSPEFEDAYKRLEDSKLCYTLVVDPKENSDDFDYNWETRTITFNPFSGLETLNTSIQSPAVGLAHEVFHAAGDDADHAAFLQRQAITENIITLPDGTQEVDYTRSEAEEDRVTTLEDTVANELADVGRNGYKDARGAFAVPNPTYHNQYIPPGP